MAHARVRRCARDARVAERGIVPVLALILVGAVLVGGAGIWYFVFRDTAPERANIKSASKSVDRKAEDDGPATSDIAGTWSVDTTIGSFDPDADDYTSAWVGYRVQEELAGIGAKTAFGRTPDVSGSLTIEGTSVTAVEIEADLTSLQSDDSRRDGQLGHQAIETERFPTSTFTLTQPIVDAFTREPLEGGVGVLVLTGLYPFSQTMPLIRYWTGDLVEIGPQCERAGDRGFRCRGRLASSLVHPGPVGDPLLVSSQDVQHFLDGRPEVATAPHPAYRLGLIRSELGPAKFELRKVDALRLEVRIELRFSGVIYPQAAAAMSQATRNHLFDASPRLGQLHRSGACDLNVELLSPGALAATWAKW